MGTDYPLLQRNIKSLTAQVQLCLFHIIRRSSSFILQATVAKEVLEEVPYLDAIFAPVAGGLVSGIATAAKAIKPDIKSESSTSTILCSSI